MSELRTDIDAYYVALGDERYEPTVHAQGAWRDDEQHMAPVSGVVAHAIGRHEAREGMQLARISYDILGMIPARPFEITCETVRSGRTIELVEATMTCAGRDVVRARAWRLCTQDTSAVAGTHHTPMPDPTTWPVWNGMRQWDGGYIRSVEFRAEPSRAEPTPEGQQREPGRGRAWLATEVRLVDGEDTDPVASFLGLVDTANGIAPRERPSEWLFPNVDLTVHLYRTPTGTPVGLDTDASFGPSGLGLTSTTLHDVHGPVGRAEQILTVRPR